MNPILLMVIFFSGSFVLYGAAIVVLLDAGLSTKIISKKGQISTQLAKRYLGMWLMVLSINLLMSNLFLGIGTSEWKFIDVVYLFVILCILFLPFFLFGMVLNIFVSRKRIKEMLSHIHEIQAS